MMAAVETSIYPRQLGAFRRTVEGDSKFKNTLENHELDAFFATGAGNAPIHFMRLEDEAPESSTAFRARPNSIDQELYAIFAAAQYEQLDNGVETTFFRNLSDFILRHEERGLGALSAVVFGQAFDAAIIAEALRYLGKLEYPLWLRERRQILEQALTLSSAKVRDGALVGIASIGEPKSAAAVRNAIKREQISDLRRDMERVLKYIGKA